MFSFTFSYIQLRLGFWEDEIVNSKHMAFARLRTSWHRKIVESHDGTEQNALLD